MNIQHSSEFEYNLVNLADRIGDGDVYIVGIIQWLVHDDDSRPLSLR